MSNTPDLRKLAEPFPPSKVSWRVGQITKANKNKASALCYIDARDVMERLDQVCGPGGWEDSYAETPRGRVICTIRIRINGEWVAKSDGAGDTAVEGEKGGISDSFKRAAVKWGIGRYLYDIPIQWVKVNDYKQIEPSEFAKLERALPGSRVAPAEDDETPAPYDTSLIRAGTLELWTAAFRKRTDDAPDMDALNLMVRNNTKGLERVKERNAEEYENLMDRVNKRRGFFVQAPADKKVA